MRRISTHSGSALLIVLGMLSFMVVSAVGFAAYMRNTRLPSSYLRRSVASRLLVKAALAKAMETIDFSVANNPYPGVGTGTCTDGVRADRLGLGSDCYNYWYNHVYIGTNGWMTYASNLDPETVSTLTFESLAYLPPPLVNEARRYSRLSRAGIWHNLDYDAGRYAFCAVDVSDYFDVNRLRADTRRNSAASRISLSYLFENKDRSGYSNPTPSQWDTFMSDKFLTDKSNDELEKEPGLIEQNTIPAVSLADLNLAMGEKGWSPFCEYADGSKGQNTKFYGDASSDELLRIRNMMFVTDSYLPCDSEDSALTRLKARLENAGDLTKVYDFADAGNQPFTDIDDSEEPNGASVLTVVQDVQKSNAFGDFYRHKLCAGDIVSLYDYLDGDDVPVSLAMPTCERVPMIAGLSEKINASIANVGGASPSQEDGKDEHKVGGVKETTYTWKGSLGNLATTMSVSEMKALVAFPFRNQNPRKSCTLQGCVRLFFAPKDAAYETRISHASGLAPTDANNFKQSSYRDGIYNIPLTEQQLSFSKPGTYSEAVKEVNFNGIPEARNMQNLDALFVIKAKLVQTYIDNGYGQPVLDPDSAEWQLDTGATKCNIRPLKSDLSGMMDDYADQGFQSAVKTWLDKIKASVQSNEKVDLPEVRPYAVTFFRVMEGEDTVDAVPATGYSDKLYNDIANDSGVFGVLLNQSNDALMILGTEDAAENVPVFSFSPSGMKGLSSGANYVFEPASGKTVLYCADPRFNYAPENWFAPDGTSTMSAQDWCEKSSAYKLGSDYDIFFNVSNCGYLQSVYELAFLPRLSENFTADTSNELGYPKVSSRTDYPAKASETAFANFNWQTYTPYEKDGYRDEFEKLGFYSSVGGFRVNPCSPDVRSVMAAFANTPMGWAYTATNATSRTKYGKMTAQEFNSQYAYSGFNSEALVSAGALEDIVGAFQSAVQAQSGDWEKAFDSLTWYNKDANAGTFLGVTLDEGLKLYDADRKMLYGFWKESMANRQQLYLIFVRAEPMMMGGGKVGATPPQLGGRAVALVWRDPRNPTSVKSSNDENAPHPMRILFYRTLD